MSGRILLYKGRSQSWGNAIFAAYVSFLLWVIGYSPDYLQLLRQAVDSGKTLLIIDEPSRELSEEEMQEVDSMLMEAVQRGAMVVTANSRFMQNQVSL